MWQFPIGLALLSRISDMAGQQNPHHEFLSSSPHTSSPPLHLLSSTPSPRLRRPPPLLLTTLLRRRPPPYGAPPLATSSSSWCSCSGDLLFLPLLLHRRGHRSAAPRPLERGN